jgi:hypothetical protein
MHASLEQLISLRDDEPVALEVQQHLRACDDCARALDQLTALRDGLTGLADPVPPPDVWQRIAAEAADAAPAGRRRGAWLPTAGAALAASVIAAVLLVNMRMQVPAAAPGTTAGGPLMAAAGAEKTQNLDQLKAQSRYLEHAVLSLDRNADQMVVSAGSASTVAALQDRIALLDDEINNISARPDSAEQMKQLWRQRVDLLQSLAAVRYAQVVNNGI